MALIVVTDESGAVSIKGDLPDGKYTIEAFHQKAGTLTQEIEVKGGDGKAYGLRAKGSVVTFDGFLKIYEEGRDDRPRQLLAPARQCRCTAGRRRPESLSAPPLIHAPAEAERAPG